MSFMIPLNIQSIKLIRLKWQESFQSLVSSLLTDTDTQVRRTLLEFSVAKLCVFFGRQRGNSHFYSYFYSYPTHCSLLLFAISVVIFIHVLGLLFLIITGCSFILPLV